MAEKQSRMLLDEKEMEVLRLFKGLESEICTCGDESCQFGHTELVYHRIMPTLAAAK